MHGASRELGTLYRAPYKIAAVESRDELLRLLSHTLRNLYKHLAGHQVFLADQHGAMKPAGEAGSIKAGQEWFRGSGRLQDVSSDWRFVPALHGVRRARQMSAPLLDGRVPLGLIVVETRQGHPFDSLDLEVLEAVAGLFSLAFLRLRSRQSERRRASIELDRREAGGVQRRLMSGTLPADAGVRVDTRYRPALEVGGDFYDIARLVDGRIVATIGDVSGKGMSAALIMSRVSSDLGRAMRSGDEPSKVLESINGDMTDVESETFVTAACISLDPRSGSLSIANAGHLPLMVRRASGEVFDFGQASGTPLGMIPCQYADERLELQPLDVVLLMTDGLTEAFDWPGDRMGSKRLHRIVSAAPNDPETINKHILAAANEAKGAEPLDDVTLVAVQVEAR